MIKQINEVKERAFYLPRQRSHTSAVSRPRKGELAPNISDGEFFREICLRIYHPAALLLSFHPYLDLLKNFFPPNFFVLFRSFLSFFYLLLAVWNEHLPCRLHKSHQHFMCGPCHYREFIYLLTLYSINIPRFLHVCYRVKL